MEFNTFENLRVNGELRVNGALAAPNTERWFLLAHTERKINNRALGRVPDGYIATGILAQGKIKVSGTEYELPEDGHPHLITTAFDGEVRATCGKGVDIWIRIVNLK